MAVDRSITVDCKLKLHVGCFSSGSPKLLVIAAAMPLLSRPDHPPSPPAVVSGDEPREKIELLTYFGKRPPGVLHCTTKFCDYGKAAGAEEYAQQDVSAPQEPGGSGERAGPSGDQKPAACRGKWSPPQQLSGTELSAPAGQWHQLVLSPRGLPLLQMRRECWLLSLCALPKARSPVPQEPGALKSLS